MKRIIFTLCCLTCIASVILSQSQSGCSTIPIQDWFQNWYYVDDSEPTAVITGTIGKTIELNTGGPFDDGDWNIFIIPDDPRYLTNRGGNANANGMIELEVQSRGIPSNLASLFPTGTRIEAYGDWVEDSGHGWKTELHPLYYLRTLQGNPIKIFMGQDDSGRFINALNYNWNNFYFPFNDYTPQVTPDYSPASYTNIIEESGTIARGTSDGHFSPNGYYSRVFLDNWWFSDCQYFLGRVIYGDSPYFVSEVEKSNGSFITDNMEYSVSTEVSSGVKMALVKITAEVTPPAGLTIAEVEWTYESSAGTIIGTVTENQEDPPFKLEFSMPYCPALEYYQNKWLVTMKGSNLTLGQDQPASSTEFAEDFSRTCFAEKREYFLPPSRISIDVEKKGGICGTENYLRIDKADLLPDIDLRALRWYITVLRDEDGFEITSPQEVEVTVSTPYMSDGFGAGTYQVTSTHPEMRLDISWGELSSGLPNLSLVQVTARGVTEIGENISTSVTVSPLCGVGVYSMIQINEAFYKMLRKHEYKGELYKMKIEKADREWFDAFSRYLNGNRLSEKEYKLIESITEKMQDEKPLQRIENNPVRMQPSPPGSVPEKKE